MVLFHRIICLHYQYLSEEGALHPKSLASYEKYHQINSISLVVSQGRIEWGTTFVTRGGGGTIFQAGWGAYF